MNILIINQAFYPDVVATAQHAAELGEALVAEGHQVTVIAGSRAYDDPSRHFPLRDSWKGIQILRVPTLGLGKSSKMRRVAEFGWFTLACFIRLMTMPHFDLTISLTTPPIVSFIAAVTKKLRGGKLLYWVMDLNPDEAIAAGWLRDGSLVTKALRAAQVFSIRQSDRVVVLDRFVDRRIRMQVPGTRTIIVPPWSQECVEFRNSERDKFRNTHGLQNKFVVMYSGNHSPCHPLSSLLEAALELNSEADITFLFVGGGSEFSKVKEFAADHKLDNILTLPYQPKEMLSGSLGSADLHVVVMGDPFVGIIHPCKIYNIMRLGAPFLYIGPSESHIADLVSSQNYDSNCVASVRFGDRAAVVEAIRHAVLNARYKHTDNDVLMSPDHLRTLLAAVGALEDRDEGEGSEVLASI